MNAPTPAIASGKPQVDWENVKPGLERSGTKIILPSVPQDMPYAAAIKVLKAMMQAEETIVSVSDTVPCHFYDGMVAFSKALEHRYGMSMAVPTPGFWGNTPPHIIPVRTGPNPKDVYQTPYGTFKLPNIDGSVTTRYTLSRGVPVLTITAEVKQKHKDVVVDLVNLTKQFSKERSIYKSRAIILDRNESGKLDFNEQLKFFDPHIGKEVPIFDMETEVLIDTALVTPIRHADRCRKSRIPLKRGILLEGPYGTGKSLVAKQVAKECVDYDWTFIHCTEPTALEYALHFAKMYQPCVVFAEDMDRIADSRGDEANTLINDIDGVVSKTDEIMVVFTTNFAHKIDKAFLRPGRLDAVISLRAPEQDAVERLVRQYAGETLSIDEDISKAVAKMKGNIPATIREIVERSKLAMVMNGNDSISNQDLLVSTIGMENHLRLINEAKEGERKEDPFAVLIEKAAKRAIRKNIDEDVLAPEE